MTRRSWWVAWHAALRRAACRRVVVWERDALWMGTDGFAPLPVGVLRVEVAGALVHQAAVGVDGDGVPVAAGACGQVASVSKSFAGACVLRCVDAGLVGLDEPLADVLDGVPGRWGRIVLRHLLDHRAGLPHWPDVPGLDPYRLPSPADVVHRLAAVGLRSEPGTSWSYSRPGYLLLGLALQHRTQRPYGELLRACVLAPLGLDATASGAPPVGLRALAGGRASRPAAPWDTRAMVGTGDIWSTASDLARWPALLHAPGFLSEPTRQLLRGPGSPVAARDGELEDVRYAFGWHEATLDGRALAFAVGDQPGATCFVAHDRQAQVVVAALAPDDVDLLPAVRAALTAARRSAARP